jgi:hypothetical protein
VQEYKEELKKAGFEDIHLEADLEAAKQAIEEGPCCLPEGTTKEQAIARLADWDKSKGNSFLPHLISARKPK